MHLGTARCAYHSWLIARSTGGRMILRIDDTDVTRHSEPAVAVIDDVLDWLRLDNDLRVRQSQRGPLYARLADLLLSAGLARRDDGCIRLAPASIPDSWTDTVGGTIRVTKSDVAAIDGLVLVRSDGSPTYHLASVADDMDLGVTWVVRGIDHLSNTAKHVVLWTALASVPWDGAGRPLPLWSHVGLITQGGKKLSKRDGASSMLRYRVAGTDPDALLNWVLRPGWGPTVDDRTTKVIDRARALELFLDGAACGRRPRTWTLPCSRATTGNTGVPRIGRRARSLRHVRRFRLPSHRCPGARDLWAWLATGVGNVSLIERLQRHRQRLGPVARAQAVPEGSVPRQDAKQYRGYSRRLGLLRVPGQVVDEERGADAREGIGLAVAVADADDVVDETRKHGFGEQGRRPLDGRIPCGDDDEAEPAEREFPAGCGGAGDGRRRGRAFGRVKGLVHVKRELDETPRRAAGRDDPQRPRVCYDRVARVGERVVEIYGDSLPSHPLPPRAENALRDIMGPRAASGRREPLPRDAGVTSMEVVPLTGA
jgi:glutamyl-tRNA synthetase